MLNGNNIEGQSSNDCGEFVTINRCIKEAVIQSYSGNNI